MHIFNHSAGEAEAARSESEKGLGYIVHSRTPELHIETLSQKNKTNQKINFCMCALFCLHVCLCTTVCPWYPHIPFLATGATDNCELLYVCSELNPSPLEK